MMRPLVAWTILTACAFGQTLYLVDSNNDLLYTVNPATGAATTIGSTLPMTTPAGLAHDGSSLYALDLGATSGSNGAFCTLNTSTGAPTVLGATGIAGWQDVTFDASTNQFFAVNQSNTLYGISPTGAATLVGSTTGASLVTAIAADSSGTLWGIEFSTGRLGTINKTTGAFTLVVTVSPANMQGMSFHPTTGVLYASNTNTDSLYTISTTTGAATLVGAHGNGVQFAKGLSFERPCPVAIWQVNSPESTLTIDGVLASPCNRALTTKAVNAQATLVLASSLASTAFEAVVAVAPLVPLGGGGIPTAGGQLLNVDFAAPSLFFLNGGLAPAFVPLPVALTLNFNAPPSPITLSIQMATLNPANPDGISLSQGAQLNVL